VLYALLEHKYGFSYVQQFLTQNVLDELTENITERFYQSLMLLSQKNYQILQSIFAGVYPLLPPY